MNASQICNMLDADLIRFIHNIIVIIKIAVPIILVILGMLDFAKGVTSGKEDEIKKGQGIFIKRLIAGACVFFVVTIVQLVMSFVSSDDNSFWNCANQILNGTGGTTYVPSGVSGNNSNDTDKQNQTNTQNNTQNNSQNNASSSCESNSDYKKCQSDYSNAICNTIFQTVCRPDDDFVLWPHRNDYDESILNGVTCNSNIYQQEFYSCVVSKKSVDECLKYMGNYCHK